MLMFSGALNAILLSISLLQAEPAIRLDQASRPRLPDGTEQSQLAVVVFEIQIGADGAVIGDELIQGQPEYVERSRRALKDWNFAGVDPASAPIPASVVFLYRPRPDLPDRPMVFDEILPDGFDENHLSAFPTTVVDPGYPVSAFADGAVILQVAPTAKGTVENVNVIAGVPSLSEPTVAAVRNWEFHVPTPSRSRPNISIIVTVYRKPLYNW